MKKYKFKRIKYLDNYYYALKLNQQEVANLWLKKIKEIDKEYKDKCRVDNYGKE